jgi:hypothetical protein
MRPAVFLTALAAAGCGAASPSPPPPVAVAGTVTLDGRPLAAADIDFNPDDGDPPQRAKVRDGRIEGEVRPGRYKVLIKAFRPRVPPPEPPPGGGPVDPNEQYLPARYNWRTELTARVEAGGENQFRFALTSAP